MSTPALAAALLASLRPRDRLDRLGYGIGAALIVSGLVHVVVLLVTGDSWLGPVSYRKAVTFGLSFGLTVLTVVGVLRLVDLRTTTRSRVLPAFVAACVVEVALVTAQAWRGVPSHFNRDTPLDSAISTVLAAGGGVIVLSALLLALSLLRTVGPATPSMRLAVRAGFLIFLVALAIGVVMIVHGVSLQRTGHVQAAYHRPGELKPAHAAPMHAALVLPAIGWLLGQGPGREADRIRLVWVAIAGYLLMVVAVLIESVTGDDPLQLTKPAAAVSALGLAVVVAVGLLAAVRALRPATGWRAQPR